MEQERKLTFKRWRKQVMGWTQAYAAIRFAKSRRTIINWEAGKGGPSDMEYEGMMALAKRRSDSVANVVTKWHSI